MNFSKRVFYENKYNSMTALVVFCTDELSRELYDCMFMCLVLLCDSGGF